MTTEKTDNVTELPTDVRKLCLEHLEHGYNALMHAYRQYRKVNDEQSKKFWAGLVVHWADAVSFWANELAEENDQNGR